MGDTKYCGSEALYNINYNYEGMIDKNTHKPSGFGRAITLSNSSFYDG
jgi:hypothetical protein